MFASIKSLVDRELIFSSAQVLDSSSNVAATTELDLGGANMGKGKPVYVIVNVTTLVGTLDIKLCHKSTASVAVTDAPIALEQIGSGVTGQYHFTLPQDCLQFVNLFYTAGTSGVVTAWLSTEV